MESLQTKDGQFSKRKSHLVPGSFFFIDYFFSCLLLLLLLLNHLWLRCFLTPSSGRKGNLFPWILTDWFLGFFSSGNKKWSPKMIPIQMYGVSRVFGGLMQGQICNENNVETRYISGSSEMIITRWHRDTSSFGLTSWLGENPYDLHSYISGLPGFCHQHPSGKPTWQAVPKYHESRCICYQQAAPKDFWQQRDILLMPLDLGKHLRDV